MADSDPRENSEVTCKGARPQIADAAARELPSRAGRIHLHSEVGRIGACARLRFRSEIPQ